MKRTFPTFAAAALCLLTSAGCRQEMANQPRYNPLAPSDFFGDGRSARAPEPGTVARGGADDEVLDYGDAEKSPDARRATALVGLGGNGFNVVTVLGGDYVADVPVTYELLKGGQERFNIYCSVCHDRVGTGRGKIVERGYLRPPSYHIDRLRQAPPSHFYEVITRGYGGMPSYEDKLTPADRSAIVAYVRALQLSQDARYGDLTEAERAKLPSTKERP